MMKLPNVLPGHWHTQQGHEMAERYAKMTRDDITGKQFTDFELANGVYMHDDLVFQTIAKDRIRWLSVQLAIAKGNCK